MSGHAELTFRNKWFWVEGGNSGDGTPPGTVSQSMSSAKPHTWTAMIRKCTTPCVNALGGCSQVPTAPEHFVDATPTTGNHPTVHGLSQRAHGLEQHPKLRNRSSESPTAPSAFHCPTFVEAGPRMRPSAMRMGGPVNHQNKQMSTRRGGAFGWRGPQEGSPGGVQACCRYGLGPTPAVQRASGGGVMPMGWGGGGGGRRAMWRDATAHGRGVSEGPANGSAPAPAYPMPQCPTDTARAVLCTAALHHTTRVPPNNNKTLPTPLHPSAFGHMPCGTRVLRIPHNTRARGLRGSVARSLASLLSRRSPGVWGASPTPHPPLHHHHLHQRTRHKNWEVALKPCPPPPPPRRAPPPLDSSTYMT